MLVAGRVLEELDRHVRASRPYGLASMSGSARMAEGERFLSFLANHAYLLNAFGYSNWRRYAAAACTRSDIEFLNSFYYPGEHWTVVRNVCSLPSGGSAAIVEDRRSGELLLLDRIRATEEDGVSLVLRTQAGERTTIPSEQLRSAVWGIQDDPDSAPATVSLSRSGLALPADLIVGSVPVVEMAGSILDRIRFDASAIRSLSPPELEDLMAELFFEAGCVVRTTPRSHDGGRDLIVVGELFPGVLSSMAIEATTMPVVTLAKASKALYQNRNFPLVMLATSGRFSAGVMREAMAPDNRLRLILAEGETISEWVEQGWGASIPNDER